MFTIHTVAYYYHCLHSIININHSELLDNDRNYSFQEAIQKQTDSSVLNTVDRDGEFVNANSREIERAMRITRDDNKFKYMDISQQVPMSKQEVKKDVTREWYS